MRLFRNKRGDNTSWFTWGFIGNGLMYLIFVSILVILLASSFQTIKGDMVGIPIQVYDKVFYSRFLLASDCLAFMDNGRTYGGVMDWKRFENSKGIQDCYVGKTDDKAFKVTVKKDTGDERTVHTENYNLDRLGDRQYSRPILIRDKDKITSGKITVTEQS